MFGFKGGESAAECLEFGLRGLGGGEEEGEEEGGEEGSGEVR